MSINLLHQNIERAETPAANLSREFDLLFSQTFQNLSLHLTDLYQLKAHKDDPLVRQIIMTMMRSLSLYNEEDFLRLYKKIRDPQSKLLNLALFYSIQSMKG